jgi:hypothetical protein
MQLSVQKTADKQKTPICAAIGLSEFIFAFSILIIQVFLHFFNRFCVAEVTLALFSLNFLYFQNIIYSLQTIFYNYILLSDLFNI